YIALMLSGANVTEAAPPAWWKAQEEALLHHLLLCQPNNYTERLTRPIVGRRNVRVAEALIQSNLECAIRLADLAEVAGCSVRSLSLAFQEQYGLPPMAYVRKLRLERARHDLLKSAPGARVTDIALRW